MRRPKSCLASAKPGDELEFDHEFVAENGKRGRSGLPAFRLNACANPRQAGAADS